jgi:5-methylcytosine-specific restriction endonuclease McrA
VLTEYKREYSREYQLANLDKHRIGEQRRRARKRELPDTFTYEQWIACLEYHNYCCAVCGNQLRDLFGNIEPHADHWIPLIKPECPGTTPDNMICLCNKCNSSKSAAMPDVWLRRRFNTRKANEILKRVADYFEWASKRE